MDPAPAELARRARRNHGIFTSADVDASGMSGWALRRLLDDGWCERLANGVFRVSAVPRTPEQAMAAAIGLHGTGVVGFESAGALWGLPGVRARRPVVVQERGRCHESTLAVVRSTLWLPDAHRTLRSGLPVTTAARTLFDLAGVLPRASVERAIDHALHRRLCTTLQLESVLFALARRGRRGSIAFRELLEERSDGYVAPASELERVARRLLAAADLPLPRFEVDLGGEAWVGRVDCLWTEAKLVVELDGRRHHGGLLARDADRRRDNALMAQGWRVLRFTWDDLHDRPAEFIAQIRAALAAS